MSMLFVVHSVCKYMLKFLKIELHFGWGKNSTNMPINFIGLSNNMSKKTRPEQLLHLKIFFLLLEFLWLREENIWRYSYGSILFMKHRKRNQSSYYFYLNDKYYK